MNFSADESKLGQQYLFYGENAEVIVGENNYRIIIIGLPV